MRKTQPSAAKPIVQEPFARKTDGKKKSPPLFKLRDQGSLLFLVTSGLILTYCYWWYQGGLRGDFIEIDRAVPLQARYQVDVNRANWPEMIQLPGLGKVLAGRILANRQENGPFRQLEDLTRVSGIGPKTLERIRPYLLPIPKDTDWAALEERNKGALQ